MELTILFLFLITIICATWVFISLALYFVPVVIAYVRRHNSSLAITVLTVVLGWTFAGWLAALLWSLNSDVKPEEEN